MANKKSMTLVVNVANAPSGKISGTIIYYGKRYKFSQKITGMNEFPYVLESPRIICDSLNEIIREITKLK